MDRNIDSSDRALVACGLLSRNPSPPANDPQGAIRGVTYRIKNWGEHYENNRSRTVKDLAWVAIPNRHDGEIYSMIMAHPKAPEIFTAWILLLQVASRCQPRGSLVRDNGRPHTPQTLAIKTRGKTEWFTIALEFLSSNEIGWIQCEQVTEDQYNAAACQPPVSRLTVSCQSGDEEQNRTEQNGNTPIVPLTLFPEKKPVDPEAIYKLYPLKVKKPSAIRAIRKALKHFGFELLMAKTEQYAAACKASGYEFIPHPATWFNDECFNDDPSTWIRVSSNSKPPPVKTLREKEFDRLMRETDRGIAETDKIVQRLEASA